MSISKVCTVIGAGPMGPGMAAVLARAGSQVRVHDVSADAPARAKGGHEMASGALEQLGAVSAPGGPVTFEADLGTALNGAELILEAVPEKLDLKRAVLAKVEKHIADDAIIATNTSGIPITAVGACLRHPIVSSACTGPTRRL
jgi:3-hydroxyacyl-CoA dehydrogenase